uniref:Arrestin-C n=1 Tax=Amphiprion ocellaris TaxID=80972 RepID=A0AAQ5Z2T9_AMPOC
MNEEDPKLIFFFHRIFKKTSGNGGLTLYLGKRDYVDHVSSVDKVDGVVKLDPADFGDRKVFVQLACAFRYGSDDLDVMGLCFRKDIWTQFVQIHPPVDKPALSAMHETLLKKAGDGAQPFSFEIPNNLPCSVSLQPGPDDKGKACGVDFEVKTYLAMEKSSSTFSLLLLHPCLHLSVDNKTVKKIKVTVDQTTDIVLYSADKYTKAVFTQEFGDTVEPNGSFENTLTIKPLLADNKEKRGLALDGRLKDEDTNLASTTMLREGIEKDVLGILVSYKIKINLMVAGGGLLGGLTASDVTVELPLMLMHPKFLPKKIIEKFSNYIRIGIKNKMKVYTVNIIKSF